MHTDRFGRLLLAVAVTLALPLGGCLTLDPSVDAAVADSTVFDDIAATESWSGSGVRVVATLASTPNASEVTTVSVVRANGDPYHTTQLEPGQSRVVLSLPAHERVTLVAINSVNSTTVERLNVTTGGDRVV
ncbi:hypothetical protein [Halomarina rubra]|uniref:Carboxypeptidase regulatory-like domain-containing protein n=1 Tax=Halomarina rubra TaxID=2071873 RepID=A0ABD6ATI5_9EURY|nr:hypothetical protein [Halomarina rubra]